MGGVGVPVAAVGVTFRDGQASRRCYASFLMSCNGSHNEPEDLEHLLGDVATGGTTTTISPRTAVTWQSERKRKKKNL